MKIRFLIVFSLCAGFMTAGFGAVSMQNISMEKAAALEEISPQDQIAIETLEKDIQILDEEIAKCEKKKKGWIAATVIGSAGVLSTGIAAAVQGAKISEKKSDLSAKEKQLKDLQYESKSLDIQ